MMIWKKEKHQKHTANQKKKTKTIKEMNSSIAQQFLVENKNHKNRAYIEFHRFEYDDCSALRQ